MHNHSEFLKRISLGAAGGLAGTLVLQGLMAAGKEWLPETAPPLRAEPGEFMVEEAEAVLPDAVRRNIPRAAETAAAQGLGVGYGVAFGALYAALRPRGGSALVDGAVLGLACWAAGYLGWLPALGVIPPVREQTAPQIAGPVVDHVAYGVATAAAYDWLCREFDPAVPAEVELQEMAASSPFGRG